MLIPIIIICVTILGGGVALFLLKKSPTSKANKSRDKDAELTQEQITAQEFVNVRDIIDRFLYTNDSKVFMYIKISPISIELLNLREKIQICKTITAELSGEQNGFGFLAVSRPIDISPLISENNQLIASTSNQKRKDLLRNESYVLSDFAMSGEVVERQFYFKIWSNYEEGVERELSKRANDFVAMLESGGDRIKCEILNEKDIYRLCNLINNPAYTNVEDASFARTMPIIITE